MSESKVVSGIGAVFNMEADGTIVLEKMNDQGMRIVGKTHQFWVGQVEQKKMKKALKAHTKRKLLKPDPEFIGVIATEMLNMPVSKLREGEILGLVRKADGCEQAEFAHELRNLSR